MLDDGGVLIGFEIGTTDQNGERYIRSIRPIYHSAKPGDINGSNHGQGRGDVTTIKAKEGFAVGALTVKAGNHIEGLSITFMATEGLALNPRNSYTSDWIGGQGQGPDIHLGGSGSLVVGFAGRATNVLEAISLFSIM